MHQPSGKSASYDTSLSLCSTMKFSLNQGPEIMIFTAIACSIFYLITKFVVETGW